MNIEIPIAIRHSRDMTERFLKTTLFKDTDSIVAKRGSVFIGLMTPNGVIGPGIKGLS